MNGHRPTQSYLPPHGKLTQLAGHARSASTPPDQSLFQLVQSRASQQPSQQPQAAAAVSSSSHQQSQQQQTPAAVVAANSQQVDRHLRLLPRYAVHAGQPERSMVTQRSGNPFAAEGETISSHAAQLPSGNPFEEVVGTSQGLEHSTAVQSSNCLREPLDGGSPVASLAVGKDPEMSPLQNGLIR